MQEIFDVLFENKQEIDCSTKLDLLKNKQKVYLFGVNSFSLSMSKVFRIDGFIDDYQHDLKIHELPILKTNDVPLNATVINCIFSISPVSAEKKLKLKFANYLNYYQLFNSLPYLVPQNKFIQEQNKDFWKNLVHYQTVWENLEDETSRNVFCDIMKYRLTGNINHMYKYSVRPQEQYFEDFIELHKGAIFVDGGGYDGDTAELFSKFFPDFGTIYLFEPDKKNINLARKRLKHLEDVVYVKKAISDQCGFAKFEENNTTISKINEIGEIEVELTTIDNEIKEKVDFIKMDLEGHELHALKGCINHIIKDHPILAIAVYHEVSHIYKIYNLIKNVQPNYKVRLRHYTEGFSETVMYFLPD